MDGPSNRVCKKVSYLLERFNHEHAVASNHLPAQTRKEQIKEKEESEDMLGQTDVFVKVRFCSVQVEDRTLP